MAHSPPTSPTDPTVRLLGESAAIQALRAQIRHLAAFDTLGNPHVPTLLLQGETGTGKGLVARVMHDSGPRAAGPFVDVNSAAIPDTLLEAELFGYEAGAFSEAKHAKPGLFEAASGGTLFLDEIDALPLVLQSKLLTALEAKRVRRLGAVREQAVDVKLIAAAQAHLGALVEAGRFRADLYHRLAVVVLTLPPLRARGEDILLLAQAYVQRYAAAHRVRPKRLSPGAEAWLQGHHWPGNVRELSHLMERVTLLSEEPLVDAEPLAQLSLPSGELNTSTGATPATGADQPVNEAARIRQALQDVGGNVVRAAHRLGLSRGGLRYRMQRHGITPPARGTGPSPRRAGPDSPPPTAGRGARAPDHAHPAPTDAPTPASGWEQKPVAVLAIDLTFPVTSGPVEPWTAARRWEEAIGEKVRGFGGVVLQRLSSLFAVAFGVPLALEQLPQRAVQAALAVRQLVTDAHAEANAPVPQVRQAVHLGAMLVETQAGALSERFQAEGDTLSVAVRLLGRAGPGELLASPQVGRLVAGWCDLQPCAGPSDGEQPVTIAAYRVASLMPGRSSLAGLGARALSPFVGRARELALLGERLAQTERGHGQVVGIVGEAGIGKSRLLYEFRQTLRRQPVTFMEGRCLSYGNLTSYLPVLDLLRAHWGISEADEPKVIADKLAWGLQEVGMDPDEGGPYLRHLFDVAPREGHLPGVSPEMLKRRTFETVWQLCLHGSRWQPLVLAVEDLHWVDPTSEDFFAALAERVSGARVLFLVTYRPGYHPPWTGKSYATQLALPSLSDEDSLGVARSALQTAEVPGPLARHILVKADGNPLFVEELVQALVNQGVFMREPGGTATVAGSLLRRSLSELQLPPTLQEVLVARIDRLDEVAKALLQTLAVIGESISLRLLTRVAKQSEEELRQPLGRLQAAEFLYERPAVPASVYTFKHALTQDVAYTSLPRERRWEVHARAAQAIEALFSHRLEEHYSELAHHYSRSGNTVKAVDYLQLAGQRANECSAYLEAIGHLTQGLELLTTLPDTPERAQQELIVQTTLGVALKATQGFAAPDVERTYARARELYQQVGAAPQLFPVLRGLYGYYLIRLELRTARELSEQLLTEAQQVGDPALLLEAHYALGSTLHFLGEFAAALAHCEQGIALYDPQRHCAHAFRYGQDPGVVCRAYAAASLWRLGYPDQALQRSHESLALAREVAHPYSLAFALYFAAALHQARGEWPLTQERAEALIVLATEQGFPFWLAGGTFLRGWTLAGGCAQPSARQGQGEEGIGQMQQGLAVWRAMGATALETHSALLAEAYAKVGQPEEGLSLLAEALALTNVSGEHSWGAELYRLKGELLLACSVEHDAEAETYLRQAFDIARRQQAKSLELRAAMSLSRLWQQQGKQAEAQQLLAEVYSWFTEGFDTADLQEAKALLEELGG